MRGGWRDHSPLLTTGFTTLGFLFEGDISVEDTRFATWKIDPIVRVKGEAKARINIGKQKRAIPEPSLNFEDVSPRSFLDECSYEMPRGVFAQSIYAPKT